jgi:hypothetical protein
MIFQLEGAIRGRLGATGNQGGYHVVHGGPIQGPTGLVIVGIDCLGGSLPPPTNPMFILAFFRFEGRHDHSLCSPIE